MSSLRLSELRRDIAGSAAFRLTLRFAGLFVVSLLALDLVVGAAARWAVEHATRAGIEETLDALQGAFVEDGPTGLARVIAKLAEENDDIAFGHYGADGALIRGTLSISGPASGWSVLTPEGVDEDEALWVKTAGLPDGTWISVGTDTETYHDIAELMLAGALWTVAIALPLALLSGALLSRAVLGRLAPISRTAEGVREGALSRRAPVGLAGDEFDRLAGNINAMLDRIEALTRNLRNVSVGIAHELRTPLARIRNRLVEVQEGIDDRERPGSAIDDTLVEIDSALATFDALLKIGQIEADAERKGFETVPFSELVEELAEVYEPVAAEQGKRFLESIEPGIKVQGNRALLAQMISNLLDNAIAHTPPGTTIRVELGTGPNGRTLVVEDDGPGVPEAARERIFDRFYRLERSRAQPGNGLGLCLVRSICSLHDFAVEVGPGAPGARFVVSI